MRKIILLIFALLSCVIATAQTKEYTVWGTMYYAGGRHMRTASGDHIVASKVRSGEHRWVALSRDMYRAGFRFNDTIVVTSDKCDFVNGLWIVKDKMAGRHKIDFLVHRSNAKSFRNGNVTIRKFDPVRDKSLLPELANDAAIVPEQKKK